jgi:hypothetical protein
MVNALIKQNDNESTVGFEHYAKDERHYLGKAGLTIANAYLNSFGETVYPDQRSFLKSLRSVCYKHG